MKQTAVEFLISKLQWTYGQIDAFSQYVREAKEMEKEQQGYSEEEVLELLKDFEKEKSSKVIFAKNWFNKFKKR